MNMLLPILWKQIRLERGARWTRSQLEAWQSRAIAQLRAFAVERSPFYRRFHSGFEQRPWTDLPILSKAEAMEHFDDFVTDRSIRLADVEAYLNRGAPKALFRGRYVVLATSGSTGRRGIFLFNPSEWLDVVAASTRPASWAGMKPNLFRRWRIAHVTSGFPFHYSAQVGRSLKNPVIPLLRLDAGDPVDCTVRRLNEWQPEVMVTYPSVLGILVDEQLAGRLRITLQFVFANAEVLTEETRRRVKEAWRAAVLDTYSATEYAPIAAECPLGRKHLLEDGAAIEIVDDHGRGVPDGTLGSRVLLTVFNRWTQPLVRYELSDLVRPTAFQCECGRPFRVIEEIEGRQEDVLRFGTVAIHPNLFHRALETVPTAGWQVVQEPGELRVCLMGLRDAYPQSVLEETICRLLRESGADPPPIRVMQVDSLRRGPTGKAGLIIAAKLSS